MDELTAASQEFVGGGKEVEVALNGSARSLWLASGFLGLLFGQPRILIVTDQDLQLCDVADGRSWSKVRPASVIATYPRGTKIGPPKGVLNHRVRLPDGERLFLHRVHFDRIRRIDGEA